VPQHHRMRAIDRDLIRGGHYGQRSCEPHAKAEHMAAPTKAAIVRKVLANSEPSTHGTKRTSESTELMSLLGVKRTSCRDAPMSAYDAVDGAHSAASKCQRVVA